MNTTSQGVVESVYYIWSRTKALNKPWHTLTLFILGGVPFLLLLRLSIKSQIHANQPPLASDNDATSTDPSILKKHSTLRSYHVPSTGFTYPSIRTVYRPHPQVNKLPLTPYPLPLLIFIHGLGGSVAQFAPLLTSLVNVGPCLSIDLPGCGRSAFAPKAWAAYTPAALAQLLLNVINFHRDGANSQPVIFIGHSMGCSLAALLASSTSSTSPDDLPALTIGFIALCPRVTPLSKQQQFSARKLLSIPSPIFDLWRRWDRRGGPESNSVRRFVGEGAEQETKRLQLRFNEQSKTAVWRRMAHGLLPRYRNGIAGGGLPGDDVWSGIDAPIFLIAGEADVVTSPAEVQKISNTIKAVRARTPPFNNASTESTQSAESPPTAFRPPRVLKSTILPTPASHALLFAPNTCRTISGLIQSFLADHVDKRLSLGWQLQYLSTEGKWDVKNLAKWQAVAPVSEPIAGIFHAMKTMREVDDVHCPREFVRRWAGTIRAVVDISHEAPVYDPAGLERGGIEYHKFPTISKFPPNTEEVERFNDLIDGLRRLIEPCQYNDRKRLIAIHCHYGFNRTGFFIIAYLIERLGWRLQDAIDEFARRRPPGVKHDWFLDTLFVRYCPGLRRSSLS